MGTNFDQYEQDLKSEHESLTKGFADAQSKAEAAWAEHDKASLALTTFREKYGRVLQALETKAVTVTSEAKTGGITAKGK